MAQAQLLCRLPVTALATRPGEKVCHPLGCHRVAQGGSLFFGPDGQPTSLVSGPNVFNYHRSQCD